MNDYVSLSSLGLNVNTPFTLNGWFKFDDTNLHLLFSFQTASLRAFTVSFFSGVIRMESFTNNQNNPTNDTGLVANQWYMLTFTFSGSGTSLPADFELYVNGTKQTSTINSFISNANNASYLGRWNDAPNFNFDGAQDEIGFWNKKLSSTEISNLWNGGSGDYATNYSSANLLRYYRCNEEDGATTLIDEQGNANGTLINFSTPPAYFIPH